METIDVSSLRGQTMNELIQYPVIHSAGLTVGRKGKETKASGRTHPRLRLASRLHPCSLASGYFPVIEFHARKFPASLDSALLSASLLPGKERLACICKEANDPKARI